MPTPRVPRTASVPNITRAVRAVIRDAAARLPEFAHIKATRVLVVAGEARRASWATIRPLGGRGRPVVRLRGRQMLYVVTLRPRFFREAPPLKRVQTILHEIFHVSKRFDGTLHSGRRHSRLGERFERRLGPLVQRYLEQMPPELLEALSTHGIVMARQWLEKPGMTLERGAGRGGRRVYTEKQLFVGPVMMRTPRNKRVLGSDSVAERRRSLPPDPAVISPSETSPASRRRR